MTSGLGRFIGGVCLLLIVILGGCETNQSGTQAPNSNVNNRRSPEALVKNPGVTALSKENVPPFVTGQVVYVPVYSEIYNQDQTQVSQLAATLSIRNTDLKHPIVIDTIDYYDSSGQKIRQYLSEPIQLAPLASTAVVVARTDQTGGAGANFIVAWGAAAQVNPPVIEAVMINTASQQGMSFISVGRVIETR
ncbi:MAG: DUF3124 domain-containing protein [Synechocystis sp.]|jgi:hypothetical protein